VTPDPVASKVTHLAPRAFARPRRLSWRVAVVVLVGLAGALWAVAPAIRAVTLVGNWSHRGVPSAPAAGMAVRDVQFRASDGVWLSGWLALAGPRAPVVILVHGFKGTRTDMLRWARFLYDAGYSVLLYDSRGCGASAGWHIGLGATEPDDILGAVTYLRKLTETADSRIGVLGISLGAGEALLAAARDSSIVAVVADSAWTDEHPQLDRMSWLPAGPIALPALPYEAPLVNALIGARLTDTRPIAAVASIAPRAVLLIHSADDANATTPLAGEQTLFAAAHAPKEEWIAPSGGHTGALAAHPADYAAHVLTFLAQYLGTGSRSVS
jgi:dipeptidyl aminopeptidase/acylaminoacyl peptidase